MKKSMTNALRWIAEHGGSCAVARSTAGGRFYLAQGETGPFTTATVNGLRDAGLVEITQVGGKPSRVVLTEKGRQAV